MSNRTLTTAVAVAALAATGMATPAMAVDFEGASTTTTKRMGKVIVDDGYAGRVLNEAGGSTVGVLPTMSTLRSHTGRTSLRAAIPAGAVYSRSEYMNRTGLTNYREQSTSFWVYVPTGNAPIRSGEWMFLHQLHQGPGHSPAASIALGATASRRVQPLRVTLRGEHGQQVVARPTIAKGQWVHVAESWTMRPGACSQYTLQVDDSVVSSQSCADIGWRDAAAGVNSKIGIYHGQVAAGRGGQQLYFDDAS